MTKVPEYPLVAFRVEILEKSLAAAINALRRFERGEGSAVGARSVANDCAAILDENWMDAKEARQASNPAITRPCAIERRTRSHIFR